MYIWVMIIAALYIGWHTVKVKGMLSVIYLYMLQLHMLNEESWVKCRCHRRLDLDKDIYNQ